MKKNFTSPEMKVIVFDGQDVIRTSGSFTGGNPYQDNELPLVPFPTDVDGEF